RLVSMDDDVQTEEGSVPRDFADWAPNPEQNYNQAELAEILRKTIQGLPPGFRVVFVLRDVEGLSTEETAETLGLSVPAVKSRLLRARLQLRERLSRYFRKNEDGTKRTAQSFWGNWVIFWITRCLPAWWRTCRNTSRGAITA